MGYYLKQARGQKKVVGRMGNKGVCRAKRVTEVLSSMDWKGKRCFIIGGGPSIKELDFHLLENELTIGVNKTFTRFNTNICYCMDLKLYEYISICNDGDGRHREICEAWKNYKGVKVFLCPGHRYNFSEDVFVVNRLQNKAVSFNLQEGIYGGTNSGFGAMMLGIALGASPLYLLGFDMGIGRRPNKTHWHEGYPNQDADRFNGKLKLFGELFAKFAPTIQKAGVDVVSLNPDGDLECFPKDELLKVLK